MAERFHRTLEADCRVWLISIMERYDIKYIPPEHPIYDWMVRHASWQHDRFHINTTRKSTAYATQYLTNYTSAVLPFAETVIYRDAGHIKAKFQSHWGYGIWLGRSNKNNQHIIGTRSGCFTARAVRRLPPTERHHKQLLITRNPNKDKVNQLGTASRSWQPTNTVRNRSKRRSKLEPLGRASWTRGASEHFNTRSEEGPQTRDYGRKRTSRRRDSGNATRTTLQKSSRETTNKDRRRRTSPATEDQRMSWM